MNRSVLAVASTGGHLDELLTLAPRFVTGDEHLVWVTADTAQSRSLLRGQDVELVRQVGARQGMRALQSLPQALRVIRARRPLRMVSTGAALAVPYLVAARSLRLETHYVESATRLAGPSLTGRIVQTLPGIHLHRQADEWGQRRWNRIDGVFCAFEVRRARPPQSLRIVVTLGTERFPFDRAVRIIAASIPPGAEVLWQVGHTQPPHSLPGEVRQWLPFDAMQEAVGAADVVVTHCGVGSVLMALRAHKCPVVVPRLATHHEHVDDHQAELAGALGDAGLALVAGPGAVDVSGLILNAAERRISMTG